MNRYVFFAVLSFSSLGAVLQATAQREYTLNPFEVLSVTGNIQVALEQGDVDRVVLETHGIPEDEITVKVDQGVLKLRVINSIWYKDETIIARVTYRKLRSINAMAGAEVYSNEVISTERLEVKAGSGANVDLAVEVTSLDAKATEGGELYLKGITDTQRASVATGGQYEGYDLKTKTTYVKASTGGVAEVNVTDYLEATANTGGSIQYGGNPAEKDTKIVLAGRIEEL